MSTNPHPDHVRDIILARLKARRAREHQQLSLLAEANDFHETIRAKLEGRFESNQYEHFARCGKEKFFRTCRGCGDVHESLSKCNLKWCPRCQWRIVDARKKVLALWASKVSQPKHLVLTQRNFPTLTPATIRHYQRSLARFRRSKAFSGVRGGSVSIEMTHEGRGWHLHSHWLLDVDWLDMPKVSRAWAKLVAQDFAICKVKDVRDTQYIQEVTKYVCDGSELAKWDADLLHEFVRAIRGRRFFFAFGSLFKQGREVRRAIEAAKPVGPICECGSEDFTWESETAAVARELRGVGQRSEPRPRAPRVRASRLRDGNPDTASGLYLAGLAPSRAGIGPAH